MYRRQVWVCLGPINFPSWCLNFDMSKYCYRIIIRPGGPPFWWWMQYRYFDLNTSFPFLGKSLYRWLVMNIVIIVNTTFYLWDCRSWSKKLDIWYSGWWHHRPSSHAQKQARELGESRAEEIVCGAIPLAYFSRFFISKHRWSKI